MCGMFFAQKNSVKFNMLLKREKSIFGTQKFKHYIL